MKNMRVLVVDDDPEFCSLICDFLVDHKMNVEKVFSGKSAMNALQENEFDFVLLDWNLPDLAGIDLCREYRKNGGNAYIIFLTGRNAITDKQIGFESGVDDYLSKPFETRELLARIRAIQRRGRIQQSETIQVAGVVLDTVNSKITFGSKSLKLSSLEQEILKVFFQNPGTILMSEELAAFLSKPISPVFARQSIHRLRAKLKVLGLENLIESHRGGGYLLEENRIV